MPRAHKSLTFVSLEALRRVSVGVRLRRAVLGPAPRHDDARNQSPALFPASSPPISSSPELARPQTLAATSELELDVAIEQPRDDLLRLELRKGTTELAMATLSSLPP